MKTKKREASRFKRWSKSEKIVLTAVTVLFSIYSISLIYPFFFTFVNSLKPANVYKPLYFFDFEKGLNWDNYASALSYSNSKGVSLISMFFNSFWETCLATFLGMVASSLMAYTTAKYNFKYLKFLYALGIFSMVIPIIGSTPAMYQLLSDLGIRNNPLLIGSIWFNGFGFSFLVLYGFFKSVSWSYAEAAFIDGAGHFKTFLKVMLPQALPAVMSIMIISAIGFWNDYMTPLLYMPEYPNVALGLYLVKIDAGNGQFLNKLGRDVGMPGFYAMMLLSLIPIIVVFVAFQKIIMENVSTGGLKG